MIADRFTPVLRCPWGAIVCLVLVATAQAGGAEPRILRGTVFSDADGDGRRDPREAGMAGVKVSNGRDIAITDAGGRYALELHDGDTVFVIKPPDAEVPRRADGLPDFWKHHRPAGSPPLRYGGIAPTRLRNGDFALRPATSDVAQALDVLVFGDPQPKRPAEVDYYERDIVEPLVGAPAAQLGLSLGDIVDDDLSLYAAMNRATARLGVPWLHLPGNHDIDIDAQRDEDSLLTYRRSFGPDTYAWEEHAAAFVLLDDVVHLPAQPPSYIGGLRESQFVFLENYLATLSPSTPVVVAAHIPLFDPVRGRETFRRADRIRLFALLQRFQRVLLLTAHGHVQRHHFHAEADGWHGAQPLHEYNVGAACGGFWSGPFDADGIPDARMADGTPNGYARLGIDSGTYRLRWHNARDPEDERIGLHAPRVLRRGAYPAFAVSANVYMGMHDSRVEFRIDGGAWASMTRVDAVDPRLVALNVADDLADRLRSFDRTVGATPSTHLWRGTLRTDLDAGEHRIDVRAFDRWDGELRATTRYRLADYPDTP